jgi:hypothetical protein
LSYISASSESPILGDPAVALFAQLPFPDNPSSMKATSAVVNGARARKNYSAQVILVINQPNSGADTTPFLFDFSSGAGRHVD